MRFVACDWAEAGVAAGSTLNDKKTAADKTNAALKRADSVILFSPAFPLLQKLLNLKSYHHDGEIFTPISDPVNR